MNANDKRFEIKTKISFKSNGDFQNEVPRTAVQKSTGYFSYFMVKAHLWETDLIVMISMQLLQNIFKYRLSN